jgi:transcriptional regulator with GAF, ATPase, and Fis domain
VAINCAAIPEGLLESELFGHEKGAFTGAVARKPGRFEMAHRGTLFLDEIGDMPLGLQAKILRALEAKEVQRVGGTTSLHVDTRVVAATNRGLKEAVAARQFREDLYFRLSVFPITVPPLRARPGDVPVLARHFVERFCRDLNKKPLHFSASAVEALGVYSWPGNVRELQNCIERAVILCDGDSIDARHLNLAAPRSPVAAEGLAPPTPLGRNGEARLEPLSNSQDGTPLSGVDLSGTLGEAVRRVTAEVERVKLTEALRDAKGDKGRAAAMLQVSYRAFLQKQRDHGIPD